MRNIEQITGLQLAWLGERIAQRGQLGGVVHCRQFQTAGNKASNNQRLLRAR
jgi:hypothetical protein